MSGRASSPPECTQRGDAISSEGRPEGQRKGLPGKGAYVVKGRHRRIVARVHVNPAFDQEEVQDLQPLRAHRIGQWVRVVMYHVLLSHLLAKEERKFICLSLSFGQEVAEQNRVYHDPYPLHDAIGTEGLEGLEFLLERG